MAEVRYEVSGDVDLASSPSLQDGLLQFVDSTNGDVTLDCAGLQFIDSCGVAVFMHTKSVLEVRGRCLRVENLHGMARRTFELVGLLDILERA